MSIKYTFDFINFKSVQENVKDSGNDYEICKICKKYHSLKIFNNKCSYCFKNIKDPVQFNWDDKKFQKKLRDWVDNKIDYNIQELLKKVCRKI